MSEYVQEDTTANISTSIYDWLETEVMTSSRQGDVNEVLNDYTQAIQGLRGGFDHPKNFAWNKLNSHISRLEGWLRDYSEVSPEDKDFDTFASRITFGGLMQISGSYRDQCYIEAKSAEEYLERRQRVTGINLTNAIRNRLSDRLGDSVDFANVQIDIEELSRSFRKVSDLGTRAVKAMCSRAVIGYDFGQPDSRSAREMMVAQSHWLDYTVDSILVTAKLKQGDLGAVPFWEPISITEQSGSIYYPLRNPVNWPEVMAPQSSSDSR
ncbi:MAG: hypothetical protein ACREGG_03610 [Candidatus Saccharimonadales bacterium]